MVEVLRRFLAHPEEQLAVQIGATQITYGELRHQVAVCAGGLRDLGLEPGEVVGIALPRSLDYVVTMLACWWLGAAFMPLEPDLPEARLEQIRAQCHPLRVLHGRPEAEAVPPAAAAQLAYVILTSGSSGRPKAIEIGHASYLAVLTAQVESFALDARSRVLWALSLQFDASLSDLGTCLLSGGCLCIPNPLDWSRLPESLTSLAITHLDLPPAVLRIYSPGQFPSSLRTLIVGGEPSPPELLRHWARYHRVISVYGPSEATICCSLRQVGEDWDHPYLGQPIAGAQFRVQEGELWIGGPILALGYRNDPGLTRERFVELDGQRFYRSGDRVQATAEGDWIFLGRADRQLKIRGQRIEAEEIEAHLLQLSGIVRCAALASQARLIAFYQGPPQPHEVRGWLTSRLPAWMIPDDLIPLADFPLLASGKPDHPRLLAHLPDAAPLQDSLQALETVARLQARAQAAHLEDWLGTTPVSVSLRHLRGHLPGPPTPARTRARACPGSTGHVLLTGATGKLGSRWLQRLTPGYQVTVLGRRCPADFRGSFRRQSLEEPLDLSGLEEQVDAVIHCAGQVNMLLPLEKLLAVNTRCVQELLDFCREGRPKSFHFASTLSLFAHSSWRGTVQEGQGVDEETHLFGGYTQSKWLAEELARRSGVPFFCYRYGLLCGEHGDFLGQFCQGLVELGCYPQGEELRLDLTPWDWASEASFRFFLKQQPGTLHLAHPRGASLSDIVTILQRAGHRLSEVSPQDFFSRTPATPLQGACQLALSRLHPGAQVRAQNLGMDLFPMAGLRFECPQVAELGMPGLPPGLSLLEQFWQGGGLCTV